MISEIQIDDDGGAGDRTVIGRGKFEYNTNRDSLESHNIIYLNNLKICMQLYFIQNIVESGKGDDKVNPTFKIMIQWHIYPYSQLSITGENMVSFESENIKQSIIGAQNNKKLIMIGSTQEVLYSSSLPASIPIIKYGKCTYEVSYSKKFASPT